ncbi:hypothetical protein [Actinoplanes sp. NPDC026619]|uniref:hypothetical protein n=1 Tax=Actinoplanes sp. NPDC026619 TaxID=3155798 RepID=UPI0033F9FC7B
MTPSIKKWLRGGLLVLAASHFGDFSLRDALGVGTGLGIEVLLALLLLYTTWLVHRVDGTRENAVRG